MTVYGYARASTTGQTLATPRAMLLAAGVERIFNEKVSGVAAKRPELARAFDELEGGDVLVVTKLDRLRSTLDLLRIIDLIGKEGRRLQEPWRSLGRYDDSARPADADCPGRHSGFERDLILQRTNEGAPVPRPRARGSVEDQS